MFEEKDGYKTLTMFSSEAESASIANKHRTGFTFPKLKSVLYSAKVSLAVLVYKKNTVKKNMATRVNVIFVLRKATKKNIQAVKSH